MASNHTQTYGLNQWALSDSVVMADFNQDNLKTEQALLALKEELKGADRELEQTLTAALPKFAMGSYVGTGTKGAENPKSLTFTFEPKLLIVTLQPLSTNSMTNSLSGHESVRPLVAIRGASTAAVSYGSGSYPRAYMINLTWSGKTVSWYTGLDTLDSAFLQFNASDATYRYLAIG